MNSIERCKPLLGTYVEISLCGEVSDLELISQSERAFDVIQSVQDCMNFHDPNSLLTRVNQHAFNTAIEITPALSKVLQTVVQLNQLTQGLFDPTIGSLSSKQQWRFGVQDQNELLQSDGNWADVELGTSYVQFHKPLLIDLAGIAKGFAVDCALSALDPTLKASVNAGGDLKMSHWQHSTVAIRDSVDGHSAKEYKMLAPALATSATYFNDKKSQMYHHKKQQWQPYSHSTSVFANTCMLADGLTKVACLLEDHREIFEKLNATSLVLPH